MKQSFDNSYYILTEFEIIIMEKKSVPKGAGILKYFKNVVSSYEFEPNASTSTTERLLTNEETISPLVLLKNVRTYIDDAYKCFNDSEKKLMYITKYIDDVSDLSGYQLLSRDKLMIFLLLDGRNGVHMRNIVNRNIVNSISLSSGALSCCSLHGLHSTEQNIPLTRI